MPILGQVKQFYIDTCGEEGSYRNFHCSGVVQEKSVNMRYKFEYSETRIELKERILVGDYTRNGLNPQYAW